MLERPDYRNARNTLLATVHALPEEAIPLSDCGGRVLAKDLVAAKDVPSFDRSPYDGYALRSKDTECASKESPVQLQVLETIAAGDVPTRPCIPGTTTRIMTGAPIPQGADAVIMYERTEFTDQWVKLFDFVSEGENIIHAGEDVQKGQILARAGDIIDAGVWGTLAAQGIETPTVFRQPKVGILSTGTEILEVGQPLKPGKIYNSNRYTLSAAIESIGCLPVYLGSVPDTVEDIRIQLKQGLEQCDAIVSTGGVSAGDYDVVPDAMDMIGAEMLIRGVRLKPGMACAYALYEGKLLCGLSGNPASSLTNFYVIAAPVLRKMAGQSHPVPTEITVILANPFPKKSKGGRVLRGRLDLSSGRPEIHISKDQGNVVLSSTIGCNVMAFIPPGSGPLEAGTELKGFLL